MKAGWTGAKIKRKRHFRYYLFDEELSSRSLFLSKTKYSEKRARPRARLSVLHQLVYTAK